MPSQKTAQETKEMVKCEVLRPIGIEATPDTIKHLSDRAKRRGMKFTKEGLTTMVHPSKPVFDEKKKTLIPGKPVYVELEKDVARKLQQAEAVRVVI